MTKLITITITGVKCDNEGCDYIDNDVSRDNYLEYVNKPCPRCGSILLTEEDYKAVLALEEVEASFDIDLPSDLLSLGGETDYEIKMDGTGSVDFVKQDSKIDPVDRRELDYILEEGGDPEIEETFGK